MREIAGWPPLAQTAGPIGRGSTLADRGRAAAYAKGRWGTVENRSAENWGNDRTEGFYGVKRSCPSGREYLSNLY